MKLTSSILEFAARLRSHIEGVSAPSPLQGSIPPVLADEAFNQLALELYELQLRHNPAYARYCRRRLHRSISHWTEIPPIPAVAFKELAMTCLHPAEYTCEFHSSGTTNGNPARHFHHQDSLALYEASLWSWFQAHCAPGLAGHQLIFLSPPPSQAPHSSLLHMFDIIGKHSGSQSSFFAGRIAPGTGAWTLDAAQLGSRLQGALRSGQPVGLLGTAFHFVHLLDYLAERGESASLPPGSWALETGGYKSRSRSLPKSVLRQSITERLGIPPSRIVGEYGMCELSSQAYDRFLSPCDHGIQASEVEPVFCFPGWARVRVVAPETGRNASPGQAGLVCVWDLANAWSVLAVQTEDLGVQQGGGFAWLGRAALAEPRGCSLQTG